ncbi:MAG: hypothetical protein ACTSQY_05970 [Candidatus Odinarchaeia archaeon]
MTEKNEGSSQSDKLTKLIDLNLKLKELFKDLIETVSTKLDTLTKSLNSMKKQVDKIDVLEEKIILLEDSLKQFNEQQKVAPPPPIESPPPPAEVTSSQSTTKIEQEMTSKRIDFDRPSKGPVDDIFKELYSLVSSNLSGEELAVKFEESRDKLMEYHSFHPVYHEMARVVTTLKKYKDEKLTQKDISELQNQIDNWRDRMLG